MKLRAAARGGRAHAIACALLFLLALLPRLVALRQGGPPHDHVPDEHAVHAALAMLERRDPLLLDGSPSSYPHLLPWLLVPLEAGLYLFDRARGAVSSAEEFGARIAEEPWRCFLVARALCACFGALTVLVVVRLSRRLGASRRAALVAGALVACSPLHVLLSAQARPWAPLLCCFLLAVERSAFALRARGRGTVGAALAAAAAGALHPLGFAAFLAWLGGAASAARHRPRALWLGALLATALLALAYPSAWHVPARRVPQEFVAAPLVLGGQGLYARFDGARAGENALALLTGEPALLLALVGAILALLRSQGSVPPARARAPRFLAATLALFLGLFFALYFGALPRYFLPALLLGVAWAAARWTALARAALSFAGVASAATAWKLAIVLAQPDTRVLATQALAEARAGRRFAVEAGGPALPLDRLSLERLRAIEPAGLRRREATRLARGAEQGFGALPLERVYATRELDAWTPGYASLWSREERPTPRDAEERLQLVLWAEAISDVVLARRYDGDGSALLDAELARGGAERARFDPGTADARLPGEPALGWLTIWTAERPGPLLRWHALPAR